MNEASLGLLVAAVLVGFAAAWLGFEVRRAWSPESVRGGGRPVAVPEGAEDLTRLMPALVDEVTSLRREIAAVRAAELEVALRNRHREILLAQAIKAGEERPAPLADAEPAEPPVGEAPIEDEPVDDTPVDDVVDDEVEDTPPDLTPGDIAALSTVARG